MTQLVVGLDTIDVETYMDEVKKLSDSLNEKIKIESDHTKEDDKSHVKKDTKKVEEKKVKSIKLIIHYLFYT